ncbi:MAG: energy-coupling factor transporter transmembrane protein EcfT [Clostridiales bacterium]|jgi:energy-coupling factor transport system permease protein|nr:energy-coupling factor transporter transmembrane protein EcfT [Clostridiales bacterium]
MNIRTAIGQYYPAKSIAHELDSRVKLVMTITYVVVAFFVESAGGYCFVTGALFVAVYLSKVPLKFILRGLRAVWALLIFTAVLNVFFTPPIDSADLLLNLGFAQISESGLIMAAKMAVRLMLLVTFSSMLTLTTTPLALADAIEFFLAPLAKIGFPAAEVAMMMTIALRFIPTLIDEMDKIIKAQKARGADFETGSLMRRVKALVPILVPLFISAFRRADDLATAMEARCYRTDVKRTKLRSLKMTRQDYMAILMTALFAVCVLAIR